MTEVLERDPGSYSRLATLPVSPLRHGWRNLAVALVLLVTGLLLAVIASNENMRWDVVGEYFTSAAILRGVAVTVLLTVVSMAIGSLLGVVLAAMRMSSSAVLSRLAAGYVALFRSIPLLVQLIFWFNIGLIFPFVGIRIEAWEIDLTVSTNALVSAFVASVIGLSLHESALMGEVVRGGILSVPKGQAEAARAVGMPEGRIFRRIVLPQAMSAIIPSSGNQLINLLKATSMVAFIGGGDLMTTAQDIYAKNFFVIPLLIVVTIWYLILTIVFSLLQQLVERRFSRGVAPIRRARSRR